MCDYRKWLNDISHSVKLSHYYSLLGIDNSNMTKYLKGNDNVIKSYKVELLVNLIKNDLTKIIENDA